MSQGHKTVKNLKASAARIYPDFPKVLPGIQICKGKPNITTTEGTGPLLMSELTSKLKTPFDLFVM